MKSLMPFLASLLIAAGVPAAASGQQSESTEAAAEADRWLDLLDQQNYAEAWQSAAASFQAAVSPEQFEQLIGRVRIFLGELSSRQRSTAEHTTSVPGLPEGNYVVIQYQSSFSSLPRAIETMVMERAPGGEWKVVGSFVRPAP